MKLSHLVLALVVTTASSLQAQSTIIGQWRFGEDNNGVVVDDPILSMPASVGGVTLSTGGTLTFSNSTSAQLPSSAYSASVDGGYFSGPTFTGLTSGSSFIIETWFNVTTTSGIYGGNLFYNGDGSFSGVGLLVKDIGGGQGELRLLRGGISDDAMGTFTLGQWNYVALVWDAGAYSIYLNDLGVPLATGSGAYYDYSNGSNPTPSFQIGGPSYTGFIDEVTISTFSGPFSTSMLASSPIPEPSAAAVLAGLVALGYVGSRRRRR